MLKIFVSKLTLILVSSIFIIACSVTKQVSKDKLLLAKNLITEDSVKVKDENILEIPEQKPNSNVLGFPIRLRLYNLAKKNPDSSYKAWLYRKPNRIENLSKLLSYKQVQRLGQSFLVSGLSNALKKVGEPPVILNKSKTIATTKKLKQYYFNNGYFNADVTYNIDTLSNKRAKVSYHIIKNNPYYLDTISAYIETPKIDSLYSTTKNESLIKTNQKYKAENFALERNRITNNFRNNGVYHFQVNHVKFTIDTILNANKANVKLNIEDRLVKDGDTLIKKPFNIYKIKEVNIYTNNSKKTSIISTDSVKHNGFTIYSDGKLAYKPKAITNAVFIENGKLYSDENRTLTSRSLSNLNVFNYPTIEYVESSKDSLNPTLTANIYLVPRKRKELNAAIDFTHSNIQEFGISGNLSLTFRNIFRGAETMQIATRGNIGSSKDMANPREVFFNILEYGSDVKFTFPRFLFPVKVEKLISKNMLPTTQMNFGLARQQNIGLDKENFSGIINYNWQPSEKATSRFDLLNIQFVRNLNVGNYFFVYNNSYKRLNDLAQTYNTNTTYEDENGNLTYTGAVNFINDVLAQNSFPNSNSNDYKTISSIGERRKRLIENNLIVATNFTYHRNNKSDALDNNFFSYRLKLETAGNAISLIAKAVNEPLSNSGNKTLFGIEYAQYVKPEAEFIKHFSLGRKKTLATRAFFGFAIPYGNAQSIPFSRSYFAGGSNDNRAWQAYSLGPGRSGATNDFNEANLKIAANAEYRFLMFGNLHGAFFADAGNIWNYLDNITDNNFTFNGIKSLQDIALGTGLGFRYDFSFFIFRLDLGYKTYDPSREINERWFKGYNFSKTVLNFGINYPF